MDQLTKQTIKMPEKEYLLLCAEPFKPSYSQAARISMLAIY